MLGTNESEVSAVIPGGAVKLAKAGERAGCRTRIDHRPPSCLVRIQDDWNRLGYVAQYVGGKPVSAYWWGLTTNGVRVPHHRIGVRDLARRLNLTRRLNAAQAEMVL